MTSHQIITSGPPICKSQCTLGEGPVWDVDGQLLHFLDIEEKEIHTFDPVTKKHEKENYGQRIGCISLRQSQPGYVCGTERSISLTDSSKAGSLKSISDPVPDKVDSKTDRFNDGICDAKGRMLAGTMAKAGKKMAEGAGQLYSHDPSTGKTSVLLQSVTCSNGLGFSPDNSILYYIDTPTNTIQAFDYSLETGSISNGRIFVKTDEVDGFPDGMCMDAEGNLWVAFWNGSKVLKYLPDASVELEIRFPTALNVTCPIFGGKDMDELFVTTASCHASEEPEKVEDYPEGGDVFCVKIEGAKGVEKFKFAG